jgi:hypothetical protein
MRFFSQFLVAFCCLFASLSHAQEKQTVKNITKEVKGYYFVEEDEHENVKCIKVTPKFVNQVKNCTAVTGTSDDGAWKAYFVCDMKNKSQFFVFRNQYLCKKAGEEINANFEGSGL